MLGGVIDPLVLLPAVLLTQVLLAVAWFPALRATSPIGGRIVVLGAAAAADVAVLAADETRPMEHVAPVLAVAMLAALAHQLARRDGRGELTTSLTATGTATVFACLGSAWLALDVSRDGTGLLVLGAVAAAAPAVVDLARLPAGSAALGRCRLGGRRDRGGCGRRGRDHRPLARGGAGGRCRRGRRGPARDVARRAGRRCRTRCCPPRCRRYSSRPSSTCSGGSSSADPPACRGIGDRYAGLRPAWEVCSPCS